MLQSQDYNVINHTLPQIPTSAHNKMAMSHDQTFNEAWKQNFSKQRNQRKTHLEVHVGMWSMGLGVLKEPLLIIPFKSWMIFLSMRSKKRGSIGRRWHFGAKKRWVWKWVLQKWVCSKSGQEHKNLKKNIEGDEWRKVEKLRKVFFFFFWRRNREVKKKNQGEDEGE